MLVLALTLLACQPPDDPKPSLHTVTYKANGGSGAPPTDQKRYQAGDAVTVLGAGSLAKTGFTFAGWNTSADGKGIPRAVASTFVQPAADVVLFAVWTQDPTYSVTYHANQGSGTPPSDPNHYQAGDPVTVLGAGSLTRTGFTFAGWNTSADGKGTPRAVATTFVQPASDVVLYAVWTQDPTFSVTYHANQGSGTPPSDPNHYQAGDPVTVLGAGSLTRTGFTFAGWNTSANGKGTPRAVATTFVQPASDVVLYAVWTATQTASLQVGFAPISYRALGFTPNSVTAGQGDDVMLAPTGSGWDQGTTGWAWTVDGAPASGSGTASFTLDTAGLAQGQHSVVVTVKVGDTLCSGSLNLTISGNGGFTPWIQVPFSPLRLGRGQTYQLTGELTPTVPSITLSWTSSDPSVASVDGQGRVSAKDYGTAEIKVTTNQGRSSSVTVQVGRPAVGAAAPLTDATRRFVQAAGRTDVAGNHWLLAWSDDNKMTLVRSDSAGRKTWQAELSNAWEFGGLAVSPTGEAIIAGHFQGTTLYNRVSSGGWVTARGVDGAVGAPAFFDAAWTPDGGFVLAGRGSQGYWDLGNGVVLDLRAYQLEVPVLVKFGADNRAQWALVPTEVTAGDAAFFTTSIAPSGDIYVAGRVETTQLGGTISWGPGHEIAVPDSVTGSGVANGLLMKVSPSGQVLWLSVPTAPARRWNGPYTSPTNLPRGWTNCAASSDGGVVVYGALCPNSYSNPQDTLELGPGVTVGAGLDIDGAWPLNNGLRRVLARYDQDGKALGVTQWNGGDSATGFLALENTGQLTTTDDFGLRTFSPVGLQVSQTPFTMVGTTLGGWAPVRVSPKPTGGFTIFSTYFYGTLPVNPGLSLSFPDYYQPFQEDFE